MNSHVVLYLRWLINVFILYSKDSYRVKHFVDYPDIFMYNFNIIKLFSFELSVSQQATAPWPSHPIAIQVEDEDGMEITSIHSYDERSHRATSFSSSKIIDDDVKSQISFIMKERLHTLAKEVARRTSTVRESLLRESPDDTISTVSVGPQTEEQRPSLMSLIGLQKGSDTETEGTEEKTCWWFPESIHPYGKA
uniref:Uncharacterized protein n=1 Tax=Heterorhabditis bacteriophora TaxID=37862 RepID=A0A1I7XGI0_HETBA